MSLLTWVLFLILLLLGLPGTLLPFPCQCPARVSPSAVVCCRAHLSLPCWRKPEPDSKVVKTGFIQELVQEEKRDLGVELGSIATTTRKSGDLQPRGRLQVT